MNYYTAAVRRAALAAIEAALAEDLGSKGDITSKAVIPAGLSAEGRYVYKERAVVAGAPLVADLCRRVSPRLKFKALRRDGDVVRAGEAAFIVTGPARAVLAAERVSLNFLSHLSGVATATRAFVDAVEGAGARIFDTRKTIPGLRILEKYAVRCGGGHNHRIGLYDQVLVKDNHVALMRRGRGGASLTDALAAARRRAPKGVVFEVEAETLANVEEALAAGADIIMLDNMTPAAMKRAVALARARRGHRVVLEASGGVTLATVRRIAATGVDRISVGAITHSARAVDISLEVS